LPDRRICPPWNCSLIRYRVSRLSKSSQETAFYEIRRYVRTSFARCAMSADIASITSKIIHPPNDVSRPIGFPTRRANSANTAPIIGRKSEATRLVQQPHTKAAMMMLNSKPRSILIQCTSGAVLDCNTSARNRRVWL
jgi:hypothetical protein